MAIYDFISQKLSEKSQEAYQYGRNMADSVKINSLISEEEKYINRLCTEIGKQYLILYKGQYHEELKEEADLVNNAYQRIESYKQQLVETNGTVLCQNCGSKFSKKAAFCSTCGAKIEHKAAIVSRICPACHSAVGDKDIFCMECGHRLEPINPNNEDSSNKSISQSENDQSRARFCMQCGTKLEPDEIFCIKCGTKYEP